MRITLIRRLQRLFLVVSLILLACVAFLAARSFGYLLPRQIDRLIFITPTSAPTPERNTVALISGHAGYDSGAICGDTNAPTLMEVDVVARIAELTRQQLENAGMEVLLLEEHDARLTNLDAEVMLSLHADSCIHASGYKAAYPINSAIPTTEQRLIACIETHYAAYTGLAFHRNSITKDMTHYHAFRKVLPTTPTAILELGFLGGDVNLLTQEPERVAAGIAESIFCFLRGADAKL